MTTTRLQKNPARTTARIFMASFLVLATATTVAAKLARVGSPAGRYVEAPKAKPAPAATKTEARAGRYVEAPEAKSAPAATKTEAPATKTATPVKELPPPKPGDVAANDIIKPGDLPDLSIGSKDAPITIVEYASMTCGHCARSHDKVFPKLKEKYIDTGKVRFIMREFPLDNLAAAASMLARCAGDDKAFPLISVLFKKQKDWAFIQGSPIPAMFEIAKQAGFTRDRFDSCLKDQKLLEKILKTRERGAKVFGVSSTPTFFINGRLLKGGQDIKQFEEIIDPMLAKD